jgi:hypothetical protein
VDGEVLGMEAFMVHVPDDWASEDVARRRGRRVSRAWVVMLCLCLLGDYGKYDHKRYMPGSVPAKKGL